MFRASRLLFKARWPRICSYPLKLAVTLPNMPSLFKARFSTYILMQSLQFENKWFRAQLQYLSQASQSRKPTAAEEQQLLQPTSKFITAVQEYREKHRTSQLFNHLSAISESIPALGWVTVVIMTSKLGVR